MKFVQINNFILKYGTDKYFEEDKALYKKVFPNSKLNIELNKANQYNRKHLDERILLELLKRPNACECEILENRGFTLDCNEKLIPIRKTNTQIEKAPEKPQEEGAGAKETLNIVEDLKSLDIDKIEYNKAKKIVFKHGLEVSDNKADTYREAIKSAYDTAIAKKKEGHE